MINHLNISFISNLRPFILQCRSMYDYNYPHKHSMTTWNITLKVFPDIFYQIKYDQKVIVHINLIDKCDDE